MYDADCTLRRSPPGMSRTLQRWGLEQELERLAHKCTLLVFRNGASSFGRDELPDSRSGLTSLVFIIGGTNEMIGGITMDKDFLEDLLAEFLFIQVRSSTVLFVNLIIYL